MKTLVVGLGNPILGDDGVGWRVAEEVQKRLADRTEVEVDCFALGGLSLMERLTGYGRIILIDSIFTGTRSIGTVSVFPLDDLADQTSGHTASTHDTSLRNALKVGRSMDIELPDDENVTVVAVEAEAVFDFSEILTSPVEAAVPVAVEAVLKLLDQEIKERII
jgi:hydrogenase maturation protease